MEDYKFYEGLSNAVTVSELNELVKELFDGIPNFRDIYVRGEISNFKNHYSTGHFYFTLKDETSAIKAVMFRTYASRLAFEPENGMKVTVHGRVSVFPRDGQYQIYCDTMEILGIGSLYAAFEQLKAKLEKEGLFDVSAKKPIPQFPKRVGVITSASGAAVKDIINVIGRRCPTCEMLLYPCLVQGADAFETVVAGIEYFNCHNAADVLIVGRGGGSIEDLWAFNSEKLARAIYASKIPVISAVGHETDFTICDFVSDLRAPTPSAAAEIAVPDLKSLSAYLVNSIGTASVRLQARIDELQKKINRLASSDSLSNPLRYVEEKSMLLLSETSKLEKNFGTYLTLKKEKLSKSAALLNSLSPLSVLSRGYGVVFDSNEKPVVASSELSCGDVVTVKVSKGSFKASVCEIMAE